MITTFKGLDPVVIGELGEDIYMTPASLDGDVELSSAPISGIEALD